SVSSEPNTMASSSPSHPVPRPQPRK
uniref:Uncharacterized protein n=1 Tax=Chinchilla lanigera TaxID=34839 RepID=A0A8C2VVW4_CHILA